MVLWPKMCLYRFGFLLIGYFGYDFMVVCVGSDYV
jgi:hypothetical protein